MRGSLLKLPNVYLWTLTLFPSKLADRALGFGLLFALGSVVFPTMALAEAWLITPSVRLQGLYDDNIRLSPEAPDEVFGALFSGSAELSRLTEIWELRGRARLDFITYTGDDEQLPDEDNQLIDFSSLYRIERGRLQLNAAYRRDTLLRTVEGDVPPEELITEPGEDIDVLLIRRPIRRNRIVLTPSWRYNITERTELRLAYRFNDVSHEDVADVEIADFQDHRIAGEVFYDLTERNRLSATVEATRFEADNDREFESYALRGGFDHEFAETIRGGLALGVRRTYFTIDAEDDDDTGFLARVYGTKLIERGRFDAILERELFPSAVGELRQTDQFILRMRTDILPRLSFSMLARLFRTESLRQRDGRRDREFLSVEPGLQWNLTRWWLVDASYRYRWERRERDIDSESADSNAVFVSLTYTRPFGL